MQLFAINGNPRKNMNTASLLEQVVKGVASAGVRFTVMCAGGRRKLPLRRAATPGHEVRVPLLRPTMVKAGSLARDSPLPGLPGRRQRHILRRKLP